MPLSQLRSCFPRPPLRSLPRPAPEVPGMGSRPGAGARPRLEPARRPRAPLSRPGRHLPGLEATSSSGQTLPTVSPQGRPGRGTTSPARPAGGTRRGSGGGGREARPSSPALARAVPLPAQGLEEPGRREGAGDEPGPTPANQRARPAHPLALTPFRPCRDSSDPPSAGRSASALNSCFVRAFRGDTFVTGHVGQRTTAYSVTVMSFLWTLKLSVLFLSQCLRSGSTFWREPLL